MTKHTILFLAANPLDTDRRALDQEARAIQAELKRCGHRDQFEFVTGWAVQLPDLVRELRTCRPTIVHFSGHGGRVVIGMGSETRREVTGGAEAAGSEPTDGLFFQDTDGRPQLVSTAALEQAFGAAGDSVKLVVLSACHSPAQAEALCTGVDCVVGLNGAIGDDAARRFAGRFYGDLGDHRSVGYAVHSGVAVLAAYQLPHERLPRCVTRYGLDAHHVFLDEARDKQLDGVWAREDERTARIKTDRVQREISEVRRIPLEKSRLLVGPSHGPPTPVGDQAHHSVQLRQPAWHGPADRVRPSSRETGGAASQDPLVGTVINGRYEIQSRIEEGGMAVVYKARDKARDLEIALKLLSTPMAGYRMSVRRFYDQAKQYTQLQHPNTARMSDFGQTTDGWLFMTMELLDGISLRQELRKGPLDPHRVMEILIQCCASLVEAHSIGIIHRDIKPDNVFLLSMAGFVKLLGFAVHRLPEGNRTRTEADDVPGTPQYMSPEQIRGLLLDPRSDLYALGLLAFEMLTGTVPFHHESAITVLQMHLQAPVPPLPQSIPDAMQQIVRRALEKEPTRRYQSADEMMRHCQQALGEVHRISHESIAEPMLAAAVPMSARAWEQAKFATGRAPSAASRSNTMLDALEQLGDGPWRTIAEAIYDTIQMKDDHELTLPELMELAEHRGFIWRDVHVVVEKLAQDRAGFLERRFVSLHQDPPIVVSPDEVASRLRASQHDELAQAAWRTWAREVRVSWRQRRPSEVAGGTP